MDPLDQRLTDAGTAWRRTQPEPPDLDRLVRGLDGRRSRTFSPRSALALVAGLLVLGTVAASFGVGGFFDRTDSNDIVPVAISPSPVPSTRPSQAAATATSTALPTATPISDPARAKALVESYEAALVARRWQTAFDLLGPTSPTHGMGEPAFASERAPYFDSVGGRYVVGTPSHDVDWTTWTPLIAGADTSRAYLIQVDYPKLGGNNAGFEQFVVAPDSTGSWRIWPVR